MKHLLFAPFLFSSASLAGEARAREARAGEARTAAAPICSVGAASVYHESGSDSSTQEPYFSLSDLALQKNCRAVLNHFIEQVTSTAGTGIDAKKAIQAAELNQDKEFESIENGMLSFSGCKPHDCMVKTWAFFDAKGEKGVLIYIEDKKLKMVSNLDPVPAPIVSRIDAWKAKVQTRKQKYFPGWTFKEVSKK